MANDNNRLDPSSLNLGTLDLDKVDDGLGDWGKTQKEKGPIKEFTSSFKDGFLEQNRTTNLLKNFARKALPDGYSRAFGAGEELVRLGQQTRDDLVNDNASDLADITREAEKSLPKIKGKTPDKLYARIESKLRSNREGFEDRAASNLSGQGDASQASIDEESITNALAATHTAQEQNEQARWEADQEQEKLRDKAQGSRFDYLSEQMHRTALGIERQVGYQDQIGYQFQRKSLELQYRSYFALRDLRKFAEINKEMNEQAYTALLHNTSLPDHRKSTQGQALRFGAANHTSNMVVDRAMQSLSGYLGDYIPTIQRNITDMAGQGIRSAGEAARHASSASGAGASISQLLGMLLGSEVSDKFTSTVTPQLAKYVRPLAEGVSNRMGGRHHQLSYIMNNASSLIQEQSEDLNATGGVGGLFRAFLRKAAPSYFQDDAISNGSFQTIDRQAAFNQLTQRSIVEIIPGYLSRILHEARMTRTGNDQLEREVYDVTSGRFTGYKKARDNMVGRVINENQRRDINNTLDDILEHYMGEEDLSEDAQMVLRERLLRDASRNGRFNPEKMAAGQGFSSDASADTLDEISSFMSGRFDLDEKGKLKPTAENYALRDAYSDSLLELRNVLPDPRAQLRRIHGAGAQEFLRDENLISTNYGVDRINYDQIWSKYRGSGIGQPGEGPSAGGPGPDDGPASDGGAKGWRDRFKEGMDKATGAVKAKLPPLTESMVNLLPEMGRSDLARYAHFNPKVLDALKRRYPELYQEIQPQLKRFRRKPPEIDRTLINRLWETAKDTGAAWVDDATTASEGVGAQARDWMRNQGSQASEGLAGVGAMAQDWTQQRGVGAGTRDTGSFGSHTASDRLTPTDDLMDLLREHTLGVRDYHREMYKHLEEGFRISELPPFTVQTEAGEAEQQGGKRSRTRRLLGSLKRGVGGLGSYYKAAFGGIGKGIGAAGSGLGSLVGGTFRGAGNLLSRKNTTPDIYVKGHPHEPVILGRDLKDGRYISQRTNKTIYTLEDIKGPVIDRVTGQLALTAEDYAQGLYNRQGESLLKRFGSNLMSFYENVYLNPAMAAIKAIPKVARFAMDVVKPVKDAYVRGEKDPRMLGHLLKRGHYIDVNTKAPLFEYKDITGEVVDVNGNVVLRSDEIANLCSRDGEPLEGLATKVGKWLRRGLSLPGKAISGAWETAKNVLGSVSDLMGAGMDRLTGVVRGDHGKVPQYQQLVLGWLSSIHNLLDERLGKKAYRQGSWRQQMAEQKAEDAEEKTADVGENQKTGLRGFLAGLGGAATGGFSDGFKNMFNKNRDEEDAEGDDDSTMEDLATGGVGAWLASKLAGPGTKIGRGLSAVGRGSKWMVGGAGRLVGSTAGLIGRGAMMAGSALVAALGAPVVLTGLALGTVAYGGMKWWNNRKQASGPFREFRLTQYGIDPGDWSDPRRVLGLEAYLEDLVLRHEGAPTLDYTKLSPQTLMEILEIDPESPEERNAMVDWISLRFLPIFLRYHEALERLAPQLKLEELDEKLPEEHGIDFLEMVALPYDSPETPYQYTLSPFNPGNPVEVDLDDIRDREADVREHYTDQDTRRRDRGRRPGQLDNTNSSGALGFNTRGMAATLDHADTNTPRSNTEVSLDAIAAATSVSRGAKSLQQTQGTDTQRASAPAVNYGVSTRQLTSLEAIRVRAYGVVELKHDRVFAVTALERKTFPLIKFDGTEAYLDVSVDALLEDSAGLFGVERGSRGRSRSQWRTYRTWFNTRFLPVILTYVATVRQQVSTGQLYEVEKDLSRSQKIQAARAVMSAQYEARDGSSSVWSSPWLVFNDPDAGDARSYAEKDLALLENAGGGDVLSSPGTGAGESDVATTASNILKGMGSESERKKITAVESRLRDVYENTRGYARGDTGLVGAGAPRRPGGSVQARGSSTPGLARGNGGKWEDIPMPKSNKSYQAAVPTLKAVSEMTGVDDGLLATFASIESNFDYLATPPYGTAAGWFQFLEGTWDDMIAAYGEKYGIPNDDPNRRYRFDPRINALMGAEFIKQNHRYLKSKQGRAPTDTDLYLAHFFGAGGANKFLSADTNALGANVFPGPAKNNPNIFYRAGKARTIGEIYTLLDEKVSKHRFGERADVNAPTEAANDEVVEGEPGASLETHTNQLAPAGTPGAFMGDTPAYNAEPATSRKSLNRRASESATPYQQAGSSAHLQSGRTVANVEGTAMAGGSTTASNDPITQREQRQRQQAEAVDRQHSERRERDRQTTTEMGRLMTQQLEVQEGMHEYLRQISESFTEIRDKGLRTRSGGSEESSTNDSSRPTQPQRPAAGGNTRPPVRMSN